MDINKLIDDAVNSNTIKIFNIDAEHPWQQLGIEDARWQDLVNTVLKKIKESEEIYKSEYHRKMTSVEKLRLISTVTVHVNEGYLLAFALGLMK